MFNLLFELACLSKFPKEISMKNQKKHLVFQKSIFCWIGDVLAMLCKVLTKLNFLVKHVYRNLCVLIQCKNLLQMYVNLKATPKEKEIVMKTNNLYVLF